MKRSSFVPAIITGCIAAVLVGCGSNKATTPTDTTPPVDAYGLYTDSKTTAAPPHQLILDVWNGTVTFKPQPDHTKNGANALDILIGSQGWGGIGFRCAVVDSSTGVDVSAYKNMHFWIMSNIDSTYACLSARNVAGNAPTIDLHPYGYAADGAWHEISIPFTQWSTVDLTQVSLYAGFVFSKCTYGQFAIIDDLWYTK